MYICKKNIRGLILVQTWWRFQKILWRILVQTRSICTKVQRWASMANYSIKLMKQVTNSRLKEMKNQGFLHSLHLHPNMVFDQKEAKHHQWDTHCPLKEHYACHEILSRKFAIVKWKFENTLVFIWSFFCSFWNFETNWYSTRLCMLPIEHLVLPLQPVRKQRMVRSTCCRFGNPIS